MRRRTLIKSALGVMPGLAITKALGAEHLLGSISFDETMDTGPFSPNWDSLQNYKAPEWYRDAKFGIWAHWGPQCQPEHGDWYARMMYIEGSDDYKFHVEKYGHPSKFGFKDVINEWKAENWDPEHLVNLYKNAGAKYFFALANHHDNFDNYNSKYHSWNSTKLGPKKDLIGGWAKAAKNNGLKFGVSVHAAHAWMFYQTAQGADKTGPLAGVPYDGNITKDMGKSKWWDGYDPQALYAQRHKVGLDGSDQWGWMNGASIPDKKYCNDFFNRTIDLVNNYDPDLVYFDDNILPLYPVSDVGLRIAAHIYNRNIKKNNGKLDAIITGKILNEQQRKCMVWDIERGQSNQIEPLPWQTDTCIGNWHYDRRLYEQKGYKSSKTVIHTLIDVVSKNGNLLLNVPVRGDGTIDSEELAIVEGITVWNKQNGEAIFGTRPWKIFGEGPASESVNALTAQGFNEGKGKPFSGSDIRFTTKGDILYAIALGLPADGKAVIKVLGLNSPHYSGKIGSVKLVSTGQELSFDRNNDALTINLPDNIADQVAYSFKILPA
ncbi:alpha-L-fucosidase [Mucilaginibacter sp. X5P1]|uniref:alpha-L-fucosidase n=1 Tax=Mucilaginibacter sp. X5P1 TaxID=2723088 RepID=UPI00160E8335|nr:alpha-L-fucosidase [Mucilaginibacter sp. X5P1]MBB6137532.1 alpha-L-fucosidase [Mucilaginibacter sp. X5P1]